MAMALDVIKQGLRPVISPSTPQEMDGIIINHYYSLYHLLFIIISYIYLFFFYFYHHSFHLNIKCFIQLCVIIVIIHYYILL